MGKIPIIEAGFLHNNIILSNRTLGPDSEKVKNRFLTKFIQLEKSWVNLLHPLYLVVIPSEVRDNMSLYERGSNFVKTLYNSKPDAYLEQVQYFFRYHLPYVKHIRVVFSDNQITNLETSQVSDLNIFVETFLKGKE